MPTPGTEVTVRDVSAPRSAPTDTATGFFVGLTEKGSPTSPQRVRSMVEFEKVYGTRQSYGLVYDAVDAFFRSGGSSAVIGRVVGPSAVKATANIPGDEGASLVATALYPGDYGNSYDIRVDVAGTGFFKLAVLIDGQVVEISPAFSSQAEAAAYVSGYVTYTIGAGEGNPTTGATLYSLLAGDDDRTSATDAQVQAALDSLDKAFGPGQVMAPGYTTETVHAMLLQHAADHNRFALLDAPDESAVATLVTLAGTSRALGSNATGLARHGMLFYPWAQIPGVVAGTVRTVPYSVIAAGLMARQDAVTGNPNAPAAGQNGIASYVLGITAEFPSETDRGALNDAGVNLARVINGQVRTYGYRTLVDPSTPAWLMASNARLAMAIKARAEVVAEQFVLRQIDGAGLVISQFNGQLAAMLNEFYVLGALYGATPDDAFRVETGPSVNTEERLANGELHAVLGVRMSPFAERVFIEVAKTPITEPV